MSRLAVSSAVVTAGLILALSAALRQSDTSTAAESEQDKLVIGNWYDMTVEKHGVKEPLKGYLLKVTDDWIVLGVIRCAAVDSEAGVPGLMHMPYVGKLFKSTERTEVCYKAYSWIPRHSAKLTKRPELSDPRFFKPFVDDKPMLDQRCWVYWVEFKNGKQMDTEGHFCQLKDNQLEITQLETSQRIDNSSRLSRLPVVGPVFASYVSVENTITKQFSLDDILYLETQTEIDSSEVASADAN